MDFGRGSYSITTYFSHHTFPLKQPPSFNFQYVLFLSTSVVVGHQSPVGSFHSFSLLLVQSMLSSSHRPSQGSASWTYRFRQPTPPPHPHSPSLLPFLRLSLPGWIDVRTMVPQGVMWKTEFCSLRMQRVKKVWDRGMEGRMGGAGLHLMWGPSKASQWIKADHSQPDAASPCQP